MGQILWRNEHFLYKDVQGIARIWYAHPTQKGCSNHNKHCQAAFHPVGELDYCCENNASQAIKKNRCILADKRTLSPVGDIDNKIFLPTSVRWVTEVQDCNPTAENHYHCASEYKQVDAGEELFYADVENFVVQVVSSYQRDSVSGSSLDHQGYFYECGDPVAPEQRGWRERLESKRGARGERCGPRGGGVARSRISCLPSEVCATVDEPNPLVISAADEAPESQIAENSKGVVDAVGKVLGAPTIRPGPKETKDDRNQFERLAAAANDLDSFGTSWGDSFKLKKLLEVADVDLDRHFNADSRSVRQAGTVIEIEAEYNNIYRIASTFTYQPVEYSYRINERTMPYVSREYLAVEQPPDYPKTRRYAVQSGILIVFKVSGQFGFFNVAYLLLMLATSMALVASASSVTDFFAIYLHKRKRNYFHLKYEVSPDFSECWKCPKCKFFNFVGDLNCKGHDLWTSAQDHQCGEERPGDWQPPESARVKARLKGRTGYRASSSALGADVDLSQLQQP